jgi:NAD(P)-dependent dehydrogenase (short-subunit alcohol dehydrogenase family)
VRSSEVAFELFDLAGKRALVNGSSQGIGFAIAQGLAAHGAEIVLNGRDGDKLAAAAAKLAPPPGRPIISLSALVSKALDHKGRSSMKLVTAIISVP